MVETVMDEHEIKQLNDYAMTKWVNEMQIRNATAQYRHRERGRAPVQHLRPGRVLQPVSLGELPLPLLRPHGLPWTVFRGHSRTSTYLADTVRTLANIADNFKPGETYNIGGVDMHTIEELSDIVLKVTGASPDLVEQRDSEILTTLVKRVDISKSVRDLDHKNTYRPRGRHEADGGLDAARLRARLTAPRRADDRSAAHVPPPGTAAPAARSSTSSARARTS